MLSPRNGYLQNFRKVTKKNLLNHFGINSKNNELSTETSIQRKIDKIILNRNQFGKKFTKKKFSWNFSLEKMFANYHFLLQLQFGKQVHKQHSYEIILPIIYSNNNQFSTGISIR